MARKSKIKETVEKASGTSKKTARSESQRRFILARVADLIARGKSKSDLMDYCMNTFGVKDDTARRYIKEAEVTLVDFGAPDTRAQVGEIRNKLRLLFDEAFELGQLPFCLKVLERQAHLAGLSLTESSADNLLVLMEQFRKLSPAGDMTKQIESGETTLTQVIADPKTRRLLVQSIATKGKKTAPKSEEGEVIEGEVVSGEGDGDGKTVKNKRSKAG